MSLPARAEWAYDHQPTEGSRKRRRCPSCAVARPERIGWARPEPVCPDQGILMYFMGLQTDAPSGACRNPRQIQNVASSRRSHSGCRNRPQSSRIVFGVLAAQSMSLR